MCCFIQYIVLYASFCAPYLGYFKTAATQGLQLCHWGNNLSLKLKLHVIEFNRDMEDMMPAIEQHFAQVLKPLVGKHI